MAALPSRPCQELLIYSVYPRLSQLHTLKAALSKFISLSSAAFSTFACFGQDLSMCFVLLQSVSIDIEP